MTQANYSIALHYGFKIGEQTTIEGVERVRGWVEDYIPKDSDEYISLQLQANYRIKYIEVHPEMFQKQESPPPQINQIPAVTDDIS